MVTLNGNLLSCYVLTELWAGEDDALPFDLGIPLFYLWKCLGGEHNWLAILQQGGCKVLLAGITLKGYLYVHVVVFQHRCLVTSFLNSLKDLSCCLVQMNLSYLVVSWCIACAISDNCGRKIQRMLSASCLQVGLGISLTAFTLSSSGLSPSLERTCLMCLTLGFIGWGCWC